MPGSNGEDDISLADRRSATTTHPASDRGFAVGVQDERVSDPR
jgi:hypothetical protein